MNRALGIALLGLCSAGPAAACVTVELTPTTIAVAEDAPAAAPSPAELGAPIVALERALRREIAVPCALLRIDAAVSFGRVVTAIATVRRVWTVPVSVRLGARRVPLHFTTFEPRPPDHLDHTGGCDRPRAAVSPKSVALFREARADHYVLDDRRDLRSAFADAELRAAFMAKEPPAPFDLLGAKAPAPKPTAPVQRPPPQPVHRWSPPPAIPDRVVEHGPDAAEAIATWAADSGTERCKSAGVYGPATLPWAQVRSAVLGFAQAGFAPELGAR